MEIEFIKEEDIVQCLNIYNYYIENTCFTLEEEKLSIEEFAKRVNRIKEKYPYIVIKENNKVLGYAYLDVFNSRSAYKITADLSIYIDHNCIHQHLENILLNEIEKEAKKYNIKNIVSIITRNNIDSISFHEKHGFVLEGHLNDVANKFNKSLCIYYFRKSI